jgi:hypothetical protein
MGDAGNGWRKSSHSGGGNCAEVGQAREDELAVVLVRDTLDRGGPVLAFGAGAWAEFAAWVRQQRRP